jgi:transposase
MGCHAGTDVDGPQAQDPAGGRARQLDPRGRRRFAVSPSAAIKLMQRVRATGSAAPARYGGHRRPLLAPHEAELRGLVEATPDITLAELQGELRRRRGVVAGLSTLHNTLRRLGLRHKKSR